MTLRVTTAPPYYPVSRADAKSWCRIDSDITDQDGMIDLMIAAMTDYAENLTGRAFVQRSYELRLDGFCNVIELPKPPLLTIDSIQYYDTNAVLQTVSAADYVADIYREPGIVEPAYLESWPATQGIRNAVRIAFTAGYAAGSPQDGDGYRQAVPANLKLWMQARISTLYDNRDHLMQSSFKAMPRDFADGLLDSLMIMRF